MKKGIDELKNSFRRATAIIMTAVFLTGCASSAPIPKSEETVHVTNAAHKKYEAFLRNKQVAYIADLPDDQSVLDYEDYFNKTEAYTISEIADAIGKKDSINSIYTEDYNLYYKYVISETGKHDDLYIELSFPDPGHESTGYVMIFTEKDNKLEAKYFSSFTVSNIET